MLGRQSTKYQLPDNRSESTEDNGTRPRWSAFRLRRDRPGIKRERIGRIPGVVSFAYIGFLPRALSPETSDRQELEHGSWKVYFENANLTITYLHTYIYYTNYRFFRRRRIVYRIHAYRFGDYNTVLPGFALYSSLLHVRYSRGRLLSFNSRQNKYLRSLR